MAVIALTGAVVRRGQPDECHTQPAWRATPLGYPRARAELGRLRAQSRGDRGFEVHRGGMVEGLPNFGLLGRQTIAVPPRVTVIVPGHDWPDRPEHVRQFRRSPEDNPAPGRAQVSQCPCGRPGARRRLGPGTRFTHSWPRRWARLASLSARAIRYCVTGGWQSSTTCWPSTCGRLAGPSRAGNGAEGKIDLGGHRAGGRRCQNDAAARPNRLYGCVWFREAQGVCACWASASSAFRRWPPSSKGRITPEQKKIMRSRTEVAMIGLEGWSQRFRCFSWRTERGRSGCDVHCSDGPGPTSCGSRRALLTHLIHRIAGIRWRAW